MTAIFLIDRPATIRDMLTSSPKIEGVVQEFARALGWPAARLYKIAVPEQDLEVEWFESTLESDTTLQVNLTPTLCAGVRSIPYRIFTGFPAIHEPITREGARAAAHRLRPMLGIEVYTNAATRQLFRVAYPQYCNWTNVRMRTGDFTGLELGYPPRDE